MEQIKLESVEHAIDIVKTKARIQPVGAASKPLLIEDNDAGSLLDCRGLDGIIDYEPTEFTFTAKAGTPLATIQKELVSHGQYLPFDPPLVQQGATLGGAVASGLNGPSSLRYGGLRDFILGIRFVTGTGDHVAAGGKVVKNAAGFDLPKFFVGSCGRFGLLTELTLKVFPQPEEFESLVFQGSLPERLEWIKKLILTPLEVDAIDLFDSSLLVRMGGSNKTIDSACQRIQALLGSTPESRIVGKEDIEFWQAANHFTWHDEESSVLVKVPCQTPQIEELEKITNESRSRSRVSLGGQVTYLSAPVESLETLRRSLTAKGFQHLAIRGPLSSDQSVVPNPLPIGEMGMSVKQALDPDGKFPGGD